MSNAEATLTPQTLDGLFREGQRLLGEGQVEPALQALGQAAHGGHGDAAYHVAMLAASDDTVPDHWEYALAYVGRAAKAGHLRARRQLAFLAGNTKALAAIDRGEELPVQMWHTLHDAVSLPQWLAVPEMTVDRYGPYIATCANFITAPMADWIIEHARPHLKRAMVYNPEDGKGIEKGVRTNSDMRFNYPNVDLVLMFTAGRICAAANCRMLAMEEPSVLHYEPGQQFRAHNDFLDPLIPAYAKSLPVEGQRVATLLIYLNEGFEGGETYFSRVDYRFKGGKGDALLFRNVTPQKEPDRRTLHAGLPVKSGEKWVFSQWIRERPSKGPQP